MKRNHVLSLLLSFTVTLMSASFAVTAFASDVSENANGKWMMFAFYAPGTWALGCYPANPDGPSCYPYGNATQAPAAPWEFEVGDNGATVTVQDVSIFGDQFAVFDNGQLLGNTSVPPTAYGYCSLDPDQCAQTNASAGTFPLVSGSHAITIQVVLSPYVAGAGYFRIDGDISADSDGDGIADNEDACPMSDLTATVAVGDCDSGIENTLFADGCTISDRLQECGNGVPNHGLRVSCTADLLNGMMNAYEIDKIGAIQSCVAQDN